jgi:hypothetical protein
LEISNYSSIEPQNFPAVEALKRVSSKRIKMIISSIEGDYPDD